MKNLEYQRQWRKDNPDKIKEYKRRRRLKTNEWQRKRYAENQEAKAKSLVASAAWKKANITNVRAYWLRKLYWPHLSKEEALHEYAKLLKSQNDKCATCNVTQGEVEYWLHVDHCHSTGKVRGLLCLSCNRAIGLIRDNAQIAHNVAEYLEKHHGKSSTDSALSAQMGP